MTVLPCDYIPGSTINMLEQKYDLIFREKIKNLECIPDGREKMDFLMNAKKEVDDMVANEIKKFKKTN